MFKEVTFCEILFLRLVFNLDCKMYQCSAFILQWMGILVLSLIPSLAREGR